MDDWTNVTNQNIMGSILITSSGEVLVWQAIDISGECSQTAEVKAKINSITKSVLDENIKISTIVIDSHSFYIAAR